MQIGLHDCRQAAAARPLTIVTIHQPMFYAHLSLAYKMFTVLSAYSRILGLFPAISTALLL